MFQFEWHVWIIYRHIMCYLKYSYHIVRSSAATVSVAAAGDEDYNYNDGYARRQLLATVYTHFSNHRMIIPIFKHEHHRWRCSNWRCLTVPSQQYASTDQRSRCYIVTKHITWLQWVWTVTSHVTESGMNPVTLSDFQQIWTMINLISICPMMLAESSMNSVTQSDCNNMNDDNSDHNLCPSTRSDFSQWTMIVRLIVCPKQYEFIHAEWLQQVWTMGLSLQWFQICGLEYVNLAWPVSSCINSVCQTKHSAAATQSCDDSITVDDNKDAHLSIGVLSSCAVLLLSHKGVGTLPNLRKAPLGTLCPTVQSLKWEIIPIFGSVLIPLF